MCYYIYGKRQYEVSISKTKSDHFCEKSNVFFKSFSLLGLHWQLRKESNIPCVTILAPEPYSAGTYSFGGRTLIKAIDAYP